MAVRYDKHLLTDNFPNQPEAILLIMDMLKATVGFPGHAGGFSMDIDWEGSNRTGYSYFLEVRQVQAIRPLKTIAP